MKKESGGAKGQVRLVAADLDDTLLMPDKTISEATRRAFEKCRECGILTAFATARFLASTDREAGVLRPSVRIVSNGAMAVAGDELLFFTPIPRKTADGFLKDLQEMGAMRTLVAARGCSYTNDRDTSGSYARRTARFHDFSEPLPSEACQFFFHPKRPEDEALLREKYPDLSWIVYRGGTRGVTACGVSKAAALLRVGEHYGITPQEIAAFGDGEGDEEMLSLCGTGVAMGNALPQVKEAAACVTKSNTEDGVAWFIEERILPG